MTDPPSRILVTGPRTWKARDVIPAALDGAEGWIRAWVAPSGPLTLVHGYAPGWDTLCAIEASRRGWGVEGHRADWRPGGTFDRLAGHKRNQHMVDLGADVCIAGILPCAEPECTRQQPHGTHGTADCLKRLGRTDIPVLRFGPGGRLPGEVPAELAL